jgi:hypothetical protein
MASVFDDADLALLDLARERFDFEQKSAGALHTKGTLFFTITGLFAAFTTSSLGRLLDHAPTASLEAIALAALALSLGLLALATVFLGRSTLSRNYQVIATPTHWTQHVARLRGACLDVDDSGLEVLARLRRDLLDAWTEAAEECSRVNEEKGSSLERIFRLICVAVATGFIGVLLLIFQILTR